MGLTPFTFTSTSTTTTTSESTTNDSLDHQLESDHLGQHRNNTLNELAPFCSSSGSASLSALQASSMAPHSIDDPLAMPKKRELSASVGFPVPSAILIGDEMAASLRWSAR